MSEKGVFEYLSDVYELNQICMEMGDPDLTEAMDMIIKLSNKPQVPIAAVAPLIVQMQAWSAVFKMKGKYFMMFQKEGDSTKKKKTYLSMSECLSSVSDSLKYIVRATS
jgi:hypothetical protein